MINNGDLDHFIFCRSCVAKICQNTIIFLGLKKVFVTVNHSIYLTGYRAMFCMEMNFPSHNHICPTDHSAVVQMVECQVSLLNMWRSTGLYLWSSFVYCPYK